MAKLAIATSDGKVVNRHFGRADTFLITDIDIDDGSWKAVESRKVEPVCIGRDHNDDRLLKNAAAFSDCEYMLVAKIGMSAANAVESFGVQVFEMPMLIPDAIDKMRRYVQVQNLFL